MVSTSCVTQWQWVPVFSTSWADQLQWVLRVLLRVYCAISERPSKKLVSDMRISSVLPFLNLGVPILYLMVACIFPDIVGCPLVKEARAAHREQPKVGCRGLDFMCIDMSPEPLFVFVKDQVNPKRVGPGFHHGSQITVLFFWSTFKCIGTCSSPFGRPMSATSFLCPDLFESASVSTNSHRRPTFSPQTPPIPSFLQLHTLAVRVAIRPRWRFDRPATATLNYQSWHAAFSRVNPPGNFPLSYVERFTRRTHTGAIPPKECVRMSGGGKKTGTGCQGSQNPSFHHPSPSPNGKHSSPSKRGHHSRTNTPNHSPAKLSSPSLNKKVNTPGQVRILTLNINSFNPTKWKYIQTLKWYSLVDFMVITEHHLDEDFNPEEVAASGWEVISVAGAHKSGQRRHHRRGGVMLLFRSDSPFRVSQTVISDYKSGMHHQAATWSITSPALAFPLHITGVYMSPSAGEVEEFFHLLSNANSYPPDDTHIFTRWCSCG